MATTKVTVGPCRVRGQKRWRVRYWRDGKPRRQFYESRTDAEAVAAAIREERDNSGAAWFDLPAAERQHLMLAYHEARKQGVDIFQAIRDAGKGPVKTEAPAVKVVIREMVLSKKQSGRDHHYADGLETILFHLLKDYLDFRIDTLALAEVEAVLNAKTLASRSTVRARLATLFNFAVRKKYRSDNPCAQVESILYHKPSPQIFTIEEVRRAVHWLRKKAPHGLAWFALSTFCGLRPEEAEKTTPERDIDFRARLIRVEKQTTKVRQRRVVYPRAEALAFLKWALKTGGELPLASLRRGRVLAGTNGRERRAGGLRKAMGWKRWPKDITRHTAASYWLGAGATAGEVAEALGNSEKVLKRDYKALVTRAQANEFWQAVKGLARVQVKT